MNPLSGIAIIAYLTSTPKWCRQCRKTFLRTVYCRRYRSAASANRKRSGAASYFWPPMMPALSPPRRPLLMARSILPKQEFWPFFR
jgi:hypothetical protein